MIESIGSPLLWTGFTVLVLLLLTLDLGLFHREAHEIPAREALALSVFWIGLALLFNLAIFAFFGKQKALEFLTGYMIEKALSVDNIFVFLVVFSFFAVPRMYQRRVLFWGILGAIVMRGAFILAGAVLLEQFHWMIFVFGGFLVLTGIRMLTHRNAEHRPDRNPLFRLFRRFIPTVPEYHAGRFMVRIDGRRLATPLLLVLISIEATDLVFAVDSIPAIFAVTSDPFIVYTSNIFAILGLRALYFLLASVIEKFHYLKIGLSFVLVFVGVKMVVSEMYKIPIGASLAVIAGLLGISIIASLWFPPAPATTEPQE